MRASEIVNPYDPHEVWVAHFRRIFKEAGIASEETAKHVSESLALYCQEYHPCGVSTADLALLIARTFCSIGDVGSAEKILRGMEPHSRYTKRWLEVLSELHHFPQLLPCFSRGVIRPADWTGAEQDRMWMLDFTRLKLDDCERHEITMFCFIRTMVDRMAVFWDATAGEGVLGVKGLLYLSLQDIRKNPRSKKHPPGKGWIDYIADLLKQQKICRAWRDVPVVISLDL